MELRHEGKVTVRDNELLKISRKNAQLEHKLYNYWPSSRIGFHDFVQVSGFDIPPGSVIVFVEVGMPAPPGARPLRLRDRGNSNSYFGRDEGRVYCGGRTTDLNCVSLGYLTVSRNHNNTSSTNFRIPSPDKAFKYDNVTNTYNPYSDAFVPSKRNDPGYFQHKKNTRNLSLDSNQGTIGRHSIDSESQESTQESSCDIQIQISPSQTNTSES